MEKQKILALLQSSLQSPSSFQSLVKVSEASKSISKSLVLSQNYQLAYDCDILKLLIYAIPINSNNTLFLLQTIITKYQFIQNICRILQLISNIQDNQQTLSLYKKYLQQTINGVKRNIKILQFEEKYLLSNIVQLKTYILKLLPNLLQLIQKNYPQTMADKLFVLKCMKANSKNQQIVNCSNDMMNEIIMKYCPQLQNTQRHPLINKTKKHNIKKIQPQNKSTVEKSILQESVATKSTNIYSLLKSQTRTQTFLTYIICPNLIPADDRIWSEIRNNQNTGVFEFKSSQDMRKQVSIKLVTTRTFVKQMESHFSDLLVMFFNLIQRYFRETDLNSIIKILNSFLQSNTIPVSVMIMQTSFLQKIFYHLQMESVYNFIYTFTTLQYKWLKPYKDLIYEYFRLSGFFNLLLNNLHQKKVQYLNPLKTKQFTQIQIRLQSRNVQLKINTNLNQQITDIDLSNLQQCVGEYDYSEYVQKSLHKLLFTPSKSSMNTPSSLSSAGSSKKKPSLIQSRSFGLRQSDQNKKPQSVSQPILPPFAVKQYRGYFSTAPVLNFNIIQKTQIPEPNQNWYYTNSKLYYQILSNLVSQNNFQLLQLVLPNDEQLQRMFLSLKSYRNLALNSNKSNSSIEIMKIISIFLKTQSIRNRYPSLSQLCIKNINNIYPIINILFNQQKQVTNIQKLVVYKTLDTHIVFVIQLFLLMLKTISKQNKHNALDQIDQCVWQILNLLFFDCMLHNIYQTIIYQIYTQLFKYGSQILLLNILFKNNLIGTIYNAYSDIVKNGVIITQWHIHSFFLHISKLYILIKNIQNKRNNVDKVTFGLSKMLSWTLLEAKIKETFKGDIITQINQLII